MSDEYSLSDVLERMHENKLGLEAALRNGRFMPKSKVSQRL